MARTALPYTDITRSGVAAPAEANGDTVNGHVVNANDGRVMVEVRNAHATLSRNVTFLIPGSIDGIAIADRVQAVGATLSRKFGPFPPHIYGSDLEIDVETSDIKLTAYRLP